MPSPAVSNRILPALFLAALLPVLAASGCAPAQPRPAAATFTGAELADLRATFARIDEENRTVKRSPEWLRNAYDVLKIRNYHALDPGAVAQLRDSVQDGTVYIIVHPAYYTFFMHDYGRPPFLPDDPSPFPQQNLADRLRTAMPQDQTNFRVMWEQERLIRDFLEYMSVKKRLVVLVLPRDFPTSTTYRSPRGLNEYARLLNEITNMSGSMVYVESKTWDTGSLSPEEAADLHAFLSSLGVKKVLLGGGYVGKCLDNFYQSLRGVYAYQDIAFVPELTLISPVDMVSERLHFLKEDGRINMRAVRRYFNTVGFTASGQDEKMPLESFKLYPVYDVR